MTRAHLIPLGTTGWHLWREAILRTTGFPARGLDRYASPACAAGDTDPEDSGPSFEAAQRANLLASLEIATDPLFREAVTWQNPEALEPLDGLIRLGPEQPHNKKRRRREEMVARYWQRLCGKNETVSFFGPVCWIRLDPDRSATIEVRIGAGLLRQRRVFFEDWALRAYAEALGADSEVRPWLPAALKPHLSLQAAPATGPDMSAVDRHRTVVRRPAHPAIQLSPVEAEVLRACDCRRGANLVLEQLVAAGTLRRVEDGLLILQRLAARGIVDWGVDVPMGEHAETALEQQLEAIDDEKIRERALDGLVRLRVLRDGVADAAGDPDQLLVALDQLDAEFTHLSGVPSRRRAGQMYAGRALCYEETARDLEVTFGSPVIDAIAGPLEPLLQAARWLTTHLAQAYRFALRELYDELAGDGAAVSLGDLWYLAQGMLFGSGTRPADAVVDEFVTRWADLFGLADRGEHARLEFHGAELAAAAALTFPADRPDWSLGRLHSPDLQLCATGLEALQAGDFFVVLSELHTAWPTFDCVVFTCLHPDAGSLREAMSLDLGGPRIRPLYPVDWPRMTARTTHGLDHAQDRLLAFADAPGGRSSQVLAVTAVTVSDVDGELVATASDGARWPLLEVFSWPVAIHALDAFKVTSTMPHTPRITVDKMVVARETWRTTVGETGMATVVGDQSRYRAVRQWRAKLGLPEQIFVKLASETKPFFADLTSPIFASLLCGAMRSAAQQHGSEVAVTVSEMLPTPQLAWLPDAAGERYFSELRIQVTDLGAEGPAAGGGVG